VKNSSTYKLLKVAEGITLFGEVTVSISENVNSSKILISRHVFDWLRTEHGADAVVWPIDEKNEFVKGARKGVEHVIKNITAADTGREVIFTIEKIFASELDSTEDTVAYAACFAAWQALGIKPVSPPVIQGRQIIFAEP
jgi:hypothetical protein